jgi:hypothetical protein
MVEAGGVQRLIDPAEQGPAGLRAFAGFVQHLGEGWQLYGNAAGYAGGPGTVGGPVPTTTLEETAEPVIEQEWLDKLDKTFVPPPEFAMAKRLLEARHVVVLQGLSRWGKTALGVRLLQSLVTRRPHCVYAVPDHVNPESAYLVDDLGGPAAGQLDVARLRTLQEKARAAKSYVVLTVDDEVPITQATAALLVSCTDPPPAADVLEHGLNAYFGTYRPGPVQAVLSEDWTRRFLAAQPLPGSVVQLVDLLRDVGHGRLPAAEAKGRFAKARAQEVVEWFKRYPAVKDRCFMVAAAVFPGSNVGWIDQAARMLEDKLGSRSRTGARAEASWRLVSPRERRARVIGAHLRSELVSTPTGVVPAQVVRFESEWLPGAILRHVWEEHDDARDGLTEWLKELAVVDSEEGAGHIPAAVALGVLGREDMAWMSRVIQPWAQSGRPGQRDAAAIALAACAKDPQLAERVAKALRARIREDPRSSRSAVAAVAYGLLPQPPFTQEAIGNLRAVLQADPRQLTVVARSMAMLCESEIAGEETLAKLEQWTAQNVPGALEVFVRITGWSLPSADAEDEDIPLLLHATAGSEERRTLVARMWRRAYEQGPRRARTERRDDLRRSLRTWLTYVQQHQEHKPTVKAVVTELATHGHRFQPLSWMDEWSDGGLNAASEYREDLAGGIPAIMFVVGAYRALSASLAPALQRMREVAGGRR